MNNYRITFEIQPSGWFGLPDGNNIVMPSAEFKIHISPETNRVRMITLSKFRSESEIIKLEGNYNDIKIEIIDNHIIFFLSEVNPEKAYFKSVDILITLLKVLQINSKRGFLRYQRLEIVENNKQIYFPQETGKLNNFNLIVYNIEKLKSALFESFKQINYLDEKIKRFLEYYDRGTFLMSLLGNDELNSIRYQNYLNSEIFINFYKAISVILGDPSIDKDYQSRYKSFGFDLNFFTNELEPLRTIRNNFDVAHYTLQDDNKLQEEVNKNISKIMNTSIQVYCKYLKHIIKPKIVE